MFFYKVEVSLSMAIFISPFPGCVMLEAPNPQRGEA